MTVGAGRDRTRSAAATSRLGTLAIAVTGAALLAGCLGPGEAAGGVGAGPTLPTPQASLSAQIQGTLGVLSRALTAAGFRLDPPIVPYRPAEPPTLVDTPRAVFQTSIPDANQGYVVIYELPDPGTAAVRGHELASFLGGGFGQTNFPLDAQFSISQVGSTLIFTWWSRALATDKTAAEAAYDAVRSVGQPIPVTK
jgi:hypothetical protein